MRPVAIVYSVVRLVPAGPSLYQARVTDLVVGLNGFGDLFVKRVDTLGGWDGQLSDEERADVAEQLGLAVRLEAEVERARTARSLAS